MPSYTVEIDSKMNCAMVQVREDGGDLVDFQIDYSPTTGNLDFHDRWVLERDYGEEFIRGMVADLEKRIRETIGT